MNKLPTRLGKVAYIIASTLGAVAVFLIGLRVITYLEGIALGRDLNVITCVGAAALAAASIALFWRIDHQALRVEAAEKCRRARWVGYGQAAQDIFDPPKDTSDTMDLMRV